MVNTANTQYLNPYGSRFIIQESLPVVGSVAYLEVISGSYQYAFGGQYEFIPQIYPLQYSSTSSGYNATSFVSSSLLYQAYSGTTIPMGIISTYTNIVPMLDTKGSIIGVIGGSGCIVKLSFHVQLLDGLAVGDVYPTGQSLGEIIENQMRDMLQGENPIGSMENAKEKISADSANGALSGDVVTSLTAGMPLVLGVMQSSFIQTLLGVLAIFLVMMILLKKGAS
jgi:hypothetical protein